MSLMLLTAESSQAMSVLSDKMHLSCVQDLDIRELRCDYRMYAAEPVMDITATAAGKTLPVTQSTSYPGGSDVTAILILVDTSDPARENVIVANRKIIDRILAKAGDHDQIGLASFDTRLRLEAPVGATREEILAAAGKLNAVGKTTELYRSILTAINILKKVKADRKSIYLMSDGLAEDKAYFHQDVVKSARANGIVITSLGFPRSVSQSVGLQTLRRLSEETGGLYVESDFSYQLPDTFLNSPFGSMDNGGRFIVSMSDITPSASGRETVTISINTASGSNLVEIPVVGVQEKPVLEEQPQAVPTVTAPPPPAQPPIRIITRETTVPAEPDYFWSWYLVLIALIFLLILVITAFFLTVYRQGKRKPAAAMLAAASAESKPYAYLVILDETKKRYPITRTTWRIGRGTDNEMVLQDSSVSRRHAEIHRDKGDVFTIFDLDSLNGIFINDNKVHKQILHEGDIIEIGEISLRFTLLSSDYAIEESTVMQHTRAPLTH